MYVTQNMDLDGASHDDICRGFCPFHFLQKVAVSYSIDFLRLFCFQEVLFLLNILKH